MGNNTIIKKNGKQTNKKQKTKTKTRKTEGSTILYLQVLLKLHVHIVHCESLQSYILNIFCTFLKNKFMS